ncbi:MAG: deoxyribose-phosphate aldolase [Kiritimatiellaeota bacterium]|nr:deoxyribose-phosphate aldolase [Kiritimatiellota bacterium]
MDLHQLVAMIDLSAVRADSGWDDVQSVAALAREYSCAAAFALPAFTRELVGLLHGTSVVAGGTVGFPSGGETTAMKVAQAKELLALGCGEIDMVQNIGALLSGRLGQVEADIAAVKQAVAPVPLKVILECAYLPPDLIAAASEIAVRAGASWVKTGTGWASLGTTVEHVRLIKQTVGNAARVKAAGGVRDLDTLLEMNRLGAERFGIGHKTARAIFSECQRRQRCNA